MIYTDQVRNKSKKPSRKGVRRETAWCLRALTVAYLERGILCKRLMMKFKLRQNDFTDKITKMERIQKNIVNMFMGIR